MSSGNSGHKAQPGWLGDRRGALGVVAVALVMIGVGVGIGVQVGGTVGTIGVTTPTCILTMVGVGLGAAVGEPAFCEIAVVVTVSVGITTFAELFA